MLPHPISSLSGQRDGRLNEMQMYIKKRTQAKHFNQSFHVMKTKGNLLDRKRLPFTV